jgi:hypothetical protein
MNFVELVNALRVEGGISGRAIESVEGAQVGEAERLVKWTKDAWMDIQMQHTEWAFLFVESTFTLPVAASVLNPPEYEAGNVGEWKVNTFRIAPPGGTRRDSKPLRYMDYFDWRDTDGLDVVNLREPTSFTIHPTTEALHIVPSDTARILFYDYWRTPQELDEDGDIPIMPARFHRLIPFWALKKYGAHEVAPEALVRAETEINRLFPALEIDQLEDVVMQGLCD